MKTTLEGETFVGSLAQPFLVGLSPRCGELESGNFHLAFSVRSSKNSGQEKGQGIFV